MKTTNVLVGMLAGVSAGALLGVLLAPDKGVETRRKIISKTGALADGLKDKFNNFVDSAASEGENIRQEADGLIAKGKKKFEEAKKDVEYTAM